MKKAESTQYINDQRREYSLYVIRMRAIPALTDGMKSGGRRVLWTARDGKKYKAATLAGATMPIHPHGAPEGAIDTLTAQYGNNLPYFKGDSAFGTLLKPNEYSASRYTTVSASAFTKDVMYADIEIVPMQENYDGTLEEPVHFLPIVPTVLLNPAEGVAIGYATNILPRDLADVITCQINHLKGVKKIEDPMPIFHPIESASHAKEETARGIAYYFNGEIDIKNTTTAEITRLPFGQSHDKVIAKLDALVESGTLTGYVDDSKDVISITLKFKRGFLATVEQDELLELTGLAVRHIENLNVLSIDGQYVKSYTQSPSELIKDFTDWRLTWYVKRYERLRDLLKVDLQRYYDIRTAIKNNVGGVAKKTASRSELREFLDTISIVYTDYIADLPVYRFTEEEYTKNEQRIKEALEQLAEYEALIGSEDLRKKVYITELQAILQKYKKGAYDD